METGLPINIRDLLHFRGIEQTRVEFKKSWNPGPTAAQIVKTLCAFANDFQNINGGYVVLGIEEENGRAILPPAGLDPAQIEQIQQEIRVKCKTRIDPEYQPLMSPEIVDGRPLLVLWAPGSDTRPHRAAVSDEKSAERAYYVRLGAETVKAEGEQLTALMQMTAKVPFDDRKATAFALTDIRSTLVREFLHDVGSALVDETEDVEIYRRMRLTAPMNGHEAPRNVALLFFSEDPERAFPGARIEVAQFADDVGGDVIEEKVFRGPLAHQLRRCIDYLRNFTTAHVQKLDDRADASGWISYPLPALEEVLVNAVYHRSYESTPEPTKVYLYPDRIEITSYPGPVPGLTREHFRPGAKIPPVPARNRRIGEMLKELRLAEQRGTGVPKVHRAMRENGSPQPQFSFDEARTYFQVTLPAHPEYVAVAALRDAALLDAVGNTQAAERRLQEAFESTPGSGVLAAHLIQRYVRQGDLTAARTVFDRFQTADQRTAESRPLGVLAGALLDADQLQEAQKLLDRIPAILSAQDAIELAIQERRAGRQEKAHRLFERAGEAILQDPRALHEFARSKSWLARNMSVRTKIDEQARQHLNREAKDMLRRVIQLDDRRLRHAWAWFELGLVLRRLNEPRSEVEAAFRKACELAPDEERFRKALDQELARPMRPPRRRRRPS
jgi:ATP-dependent DNA helicase RecG